MMDGHGFKKELLCSVEGFLSMALFPGGREEKGREMGDLRVVGAKGSEPVKRISRDHKRRNAFLAPKINVLGSECHQEELPPDLTSLDRLKRGQGGLGT